MIGNLEVETLESREIMRIGVCLNNGASLSNAIAVSSSPLT